jgi:hypothetical protein
LPGAEKSAGENIFFSTKASLGSVDSEIAVADARRYSP